MPFYFQQLLDQLHIIETDSRLILTEFYKQEKIQNQIDGGLWFVYESSANVFSMLKRHGLKIILISNWDDTAVEVLKQNGIAGLFDEIVVSSKVGLSKPDKKIFDLALSKAGVKPECSLYVGDNYYDDFIGANRAGMNFVLINHFGRLGIEEIQNTAVLSDISGLPQYINQLYGIRNKERIL